MSDIKLQIDIRVIPPKDRYPTVYSAFQGISNNEKIELINDHDLRPLLEYKFSADFPNQYAWQYIEQGPDVWRVIVEKRQ
ncbi:MAG: DUF2249 domain-containing protein [Bacillota bacterium]